VRSACLPTLILWACAVHATGDDRAAVLEHAAKLIDSHDLRGAEAALQPLLSQSPGDALALNLLGIIRMRDGQPAAAEKLFHEAAAKGPRLAGPHVNLALLYGPERASEAIRELRRALALAPANTEAQTALRSIAEQAALAASRGGDAKGAAAVLLEARAALPHDPELSCQFALAAMQAGLFADARVALEDALRVRPDYPEAVYALGRAYLGESRGQEAEAQFRRYLSMRPDDASAQYGLGYVLVSEQKLDEARAAFQRSLELQPNQTESLYQLGLIALEQGNGDAALPYLEKVLARDPRHAGALTETGILAFRANRYETAAESLHRAVESSPSYQKAHYYLALTLAKMGRKEESEREFRVAASLKKSAVSERMVSTP
jgi:Flp pilus assembly protein TadD